MFDSHTAKMMSFFADCRFQCYRVHPYTLLVRKAKRASLTAVGAPRAHVHVRRAARAGLASSAKASTARAVRVASSS